MSHSFPNTFYNRVSEVLYSDLEDFENSDHPETTLTNTLELLAHFLQLHKGRILLWDTESASLVVKYSYGMSKEDVRKAKYEICEGVTGSIMDTGEPIIVDNIQEEPNFLGKVTHAGLDSTPLSYIAVPICYKNFLMGVLAVECRHPEGEDMEDNTRVLKQVSEMFAQIIHTYSLCDFN